MLLKSKPKELDYYSKRDAIKGWFIKLLASGVVPAKLLYKNLPQPPLMPKKATNKPAQKFAIEIVSHCWQYAHLLRYQLSSIVLHAPRHIDITVSIYYCPDDEKTLAILRYFEKIEQDHIHWNWQSLPKEYLFRRAIGRNHAALATKADWIWFTDCDSIFHINCFSSLEKQLASVQSALVFPLTEHRSQPLPATDVTLQGLENEPLLDIDPAQFVATTMTRATGPLQIVHGDVARTLGYCQQSAIYQKPAQHWCKALEDRVYRWFLGTQGTGLPIAGVYRIQHQEKGRYHQGSTWSWFRNQGQVIKTLHWAAKVGDKR